MTTDDRTGGPERVVLDRLDVDDLACLLGLVEDWLLHADSDTHRDLREFWPHRHVHDPVLVVIDDLAAHTRRLRRALG
jgi:hypothetical protein